MNIFLHVGSERPLITLILNEGLLKLKMEGAVHHQRKWPQGPLYVFLSVSICQMGKLMC